MVHIRRESVYAPTLNERGVMFSLLEDRVLSYLIQNSPAQICLFLLTYLFIIYAMCTHEDFIFWITFQEHIFYCIAQMVLVLSIGNSELELPLDIPP